MNKSFLHGVWSGVATSVVAVASYLSGIGPMEFACNIAGILFVLGVALNWKHCNLMGAIFNSFLAVYLHDIGYDITAAVTAFFVVPMSLYGWYLWNFSKKPLLGKRAMSWKDGAYTVVATGVVAAALTFTFQAVVGSVSIIDVAMGTLPIIATILLSLSYREQWLFWIPFNILQVWIIYLNFASAAANANSASLLVLKTVFFVNSLFGAYYWFKKTK